MGGCIFSFSLFPKVEPLQENELEGKGDNKILLIDISGFISEESPRGLIEGPDMLSRIKEELTLAEEDKKIKAVVLRINSPGGTITTSDLIYHEIKTFKERTGKKVIVSILDLGASGAYYISMAADKILAHPTSIVGSIGVIMLHINLEGLLEKIGVGTESIKSGENKDLGTPTKPLSPEGRDILQGIINSMYGRFLEVIKKGRKGLSIDEINMLADGRIYTAVEAKSSGLIDEIGYLKDAIDLAKSESGIKDAKVVLYRRPGSLRNNIYSRTLQPQLNNPYIDFGLDLKRFLSSKSPRLLYLWMP